MSTRTDEINAFIDEMMEDLDVDKTDPELRLLALKGLKLAWDEDDDDNIEKTFYQVALSGMIFAQEMNILFPYLTV